MASTLKICVSLVILAAISCQQLDLYEKIDGAVEGKEKVKNVVKLFSMNAKTRDDWKSDEGEDMIDVLCDVIKNLDPPLIGLQQLSIPQWFALNRCLRKLTKCQNIIKNRDGKRRKQCDKYTIIGSSNTNDKEAYFNPVIFKETRHLRRIKNGGDNGTFWLSMSPDTPFTKLEGANGYSVCSWVKLRFPVDTSPKKIGDEFHLDNPFFNTLYKLLKSKPKKDKQRTTKWVDFYFVNTHLDESSNIAPKQMQIVLKYLKDNFDGEIPVVFTGGRRLDNNKDIHNLLQQERFQNSATSAREVDNRNPQPESETSFIWTRGMNNIVYTASYGELEGQLSAMLFQ